mmetsp:Transcript_35568/g.36258  ORF Transcript_35568/g.36258 Transcript_35568/m.36258 type:complete len:488 (+) Transcript_35568:209-1672(+)|eukprot:CAMPEP_0182418800 /NCGR_PEP_ID=MMETSP1167-20130531/3177_1 /TAXON_ID=2988 /ORGANISM="Mallomonas Sp, Strain CCMP3275" /LENGTH=487 /DNA_ID=CAMNT_0024593203 /DNA_START=109 /DNA_END=1572 /DNA_ORIENTATION=-
MNASSNSNPLEYKEAQVAKAFYSDGVKFCMNGDLEKLANLINDYCEKNPQHSFQDVVESFHSEGKTLLHVAAASGKLNILKYLLDHVENPEILINRKDNDGFTLLINATISESSEMMKYLISQGSSVNDMNNGGTTAAHFAAGDGSTDRLNILHEAGADFNSMSSAGTPLHWAAGKQRLDAVRYLIKMKVDLNLLNSDKVSAVLMAAVSGADEIVYELVTAKCDISQTVTDGATLLHICAENGLKKAVDAILSAESGGQYARVMTSDGNLPIHYAAMSGRRDIISLLAPHSGRELAQTPLEDLLAEGARRMNLWQQRQQTQSNVKPAPVAVPNSSGVEAFEQFGIEPPEPVAAAVDEAAIAAADDCKIAGNTLYQTRQFSEAIEKYSEAIRLQGDNHILWSNRSACFLSSGDAKRALRDAEICRRLKPDWWKGAYRLASARLALGMYEEAAVAAFEGCKLDDSHEDLKNLLRKAVTLGQEAHKKNKG